MHTNLTKNAKNTNTKEPAEVRFVLLQVFFAAFVAVVSFMAKQPRTAAGRPPV